MPTCDTLVIGAGIVGCSLARELAGAGQRVVVVDRGPVGGGASFAAAGLLSPTIATRPVGPLVELCYRSAAGYDEWVNGLRDEGAADVGYRRSGLLEIGLAGAIDASSSAGLARPGRRAELLSPEELRRHEPGLGPTGLAAIYYADDAQVDPRRLTRAVADAATRAGVEIREHEPVRRLERTGDRVTAVETATTTYQPGLLVLAAGAWSGGLAEQVGLHLPTRPVKGQMARVDGAPLPVRTPLHADEALLVPRPDGTLLLGVTVEEVGFDDAVMPDAVRSIQANAAALVPAVERLPIAEAWAGLRPATPDGWPYMGPAPGLRNVWVSTGHYRKGILLAPLCAELVARSILAGRPADELQPFDPGRRIASEAT